MSFPEVVAQGIISKLAISQIEDLTLLNEIAWALRAMVLVDYLSGSEARLLISRPRSIITISRDIQNSNRRRFGIAHEIGHLEMHRKKSEVFNCSRVDLDSGGMSTKKTPSLENEANEFAAQFLMPTQFFEPFCIDTDICFNKISELANVFSVSLTASALRFIQLVKEPLAIVYSSDGIIKWFEGNKDFHELGLFVNVKSPLSPETLAYRGFKGVPLPIKPSQVLVSSWMMPGNYGYKATLSEESFFMPNYNSVLSLIWINEIIDDDDDW